MISSKNEINFFNITFQCNMSLLWTMNYMYTHCNLLFAAW
jgi:hypothetical protein